MHVLLVHNEDAGSASGVDPGATLSASGCTVRSATIAEAAGWARDDPGGAQLQGVARVVVAGGDGSIGCAALLAHRLDVPLGVVPAGTANDFARAMGLPNDLEAACALAGTGQETRPIDLAIIDGRPFVNVASMGLAPAATEHAERLKGGLRALAYPVGAALAALRRRPIYVVATVDGSPAWTGRARQVIIASTGVFGGFAETGMTVDGDGRLDLLIVPAARRSHQLVADAASLRHGELAERDGVHHFRGANVEVVLRKAPHIVVDGELVEVGDRHLVATVAPGPLRVVVPGVATDR